MIRQARNRYAGRTLPYLKQFTVDNFKAFAEGNTVPIRPITLLFGPNSAGKSSVLHALKLYSELLTRHHLYPVGYPLGNWLHDRQPGTEIRLGAEVGLLPTEVGGSTDLNEATHSINVEVKLSLEPIRNYWGEIDRPKEPFVEEVALKINGVKALVLKGMPHISETKTERRIEWTALELREVDWSIAEFSFVIDAMLNRISNRLNWPESYLKDIKLKNTIRNHIQKGFENELFVRASDLLSGRINLLHVWDDEDRQVTFYSRRREPEAQFFQSAIQLFPGQLLDLFNKAIGLHYEDEYVGFRYREALDNAFQGEIEKIVGFLYEYHSKDLDEMQSLLQSLENQRNTWEEIKEVSRLMSFGLEDLVQTVSQLFKPVVEIMEQLRMVGPVREVGDVTVGRDASWQAMLDDPDVRKRVNEWLARLGLNYEVVPARWIDEEYLETTVRT